MTDETDDQKALAILATLSPIERDVWFETGRRILRGEDATAVAASAQAEVAHESLSRP